MFVLVCTICIYVCLVSNVGLFMFNVGVDICIYVQVDACFVQLKDVCVRMKCW